ncbi:MAG: hypothetical protein RL768_409 [Nitrospirota bacterium]|jgi:DNA-binding NarL/FixJ family response regulator
MSNQSSVRVVLIDDHPVVRAGVGEILARAKDLRIIGEGASVAESLKLARSLKPDLIVLDLTLPDGSGVNACRQLLRVMPHLRVLMMSIHDDPTVVQAALTAGAHGYVLKDMAGEQLVNAIRMILAGHLFIQPRLIGPVGDALRDAMSGGRSRGLAALSPQERRILPLLAEGRTNKEIGVELTLSEKTVKNYLANVFTKLQVTKRSSAAALYARGQRQEMLAGRACI